MLIVIAICLIIIMLVAAGGSTDVTGGRTRIQARQARPIASYLEAVPR